MGVKYYPRYPRNPQFIFFSVNCHFVDNALMRWLRGGFGREGAPLGESRSEDRQEDSAADDEDHQPFSVSGGVG